MACVAWLTYLDVEGLFHSALDAHECLHHADIEILLREIHAFNCYVLGAFQASKVGVCPFHGQVVGWRHKNPDGNLGRGQVGCFAQLGAGERGELVIVQHQARERRGQLASRGV